MSKTESRPVALPPDVEPEHLYEGLKRLDESQTFRRAEAQLRLLRFLLENAEQGQDCLKETYIGAVFYGRSADYDPRYDSIVRVNINRLRLRLIEYYAAEGRFDSLQISIPRGSYSPVAELVASQQAEEPAARSLPLWLEPVPVGKKVVSSIQVIFWVATLLGLLALAAGRTSMHTIYTVTVICQATSTLILVLLAFTGPRLPGLRTMAAACCLHTAVIFVIPLWSSMLMPISRYYWTAAALSAAAQPVFFLLLDAGLRSLMEERRRSLRPRLGSRAIMLLTGVSVLLIVALTPWNQLWATQIARCVSVVLMAHTVRGLWQAKSSAIRVPVLVTAALLAAILITILARVPIEPFYVGVASPLRTYLAKLSIIEVTLLAFSFIAMQQAVSKRILHREMKRTSFDGQRRAIED